MANNDWLWNPDAFAGMIQGNGTPDDRRHPLPPWMRQQQGGKQGRGQSQKKQNTSTAAAQQQQRLDPWSNIDMELWPGISSPSVDFQYQVQTALLSGGVDITRLSADQLNRIYQNAWEDAYIARSWNDAIGSTTGNLSAVVGDITSQLFSPSSSNTRLMSMGIGFLREQGRSLSSGQQKAVDAGTANVPKPFDVSAATSLDFGESWNGLTEKGIDYAMDAGTPLYAPFGGVISTEDSGRGGWGKRVFVTLDNGWKFAIGHMTSFSVIDGQRVNPGDILGASGGDVNDPSSGVSSGPHIEVQWIDPQGQYQNPHTIMDPILSGTTFEGIGQQGAFGTGVSQQGQQDRLLGIDPILEARFPKAVSLWQQYFGKRPTAQQLTQLVGGAAGQTQQAASQAQTDLASLARQAGFPENQIPIAVAVALAESSGNPAAIGKEFGEKGLWQIYPGAHPDLDKKYNLLDPLQNAMAAVEVWKSSGWGAWSTYTQGSYLSFMGKNAQVQTGSAGATAAQQLDPRQLEDKIRSMPSHMNGMNMGQYTDMRGLVDQTSQSMLGHAGTDGIVQELFNAKKTDPTSVKDWYGMHSPNEIDAASYNHVVAASRPYLASIYNESGFDPRWTNHIYPQGGQPGMPNPGTGSTAPQPPPQEPYNTYPDTPV